MKLRLLSVLLPALLLFVSAAAQQVKFNPPAPGRDPAQPIDEEYTAKIREYTTKPFFNSPLTDYLPKSPNVPTPKAVLGDVAGAPNMLPYSEEVHKYMRMLEKAAPGRVKVVSIGTSEEGREMIAVAISSETNIAQMEANRARLAQLADPRAIKMNDTEAEKLIGASVPVYYLTGAIHSTETGSPTALMELAYRLTVDDAPYIKAIRSNVITLITPVVETDGRNRLVDIYRWHVNNPGKNWPPLLYWGHYVAHDNNRDAMALTLKLTRNVLNTYLANKPIVLHDLHESVAYLYDNTIGDTPYNSWVDPILTNEWQLIGWHNVNEMTKYGMPGVFAHGSFDTWSPSYLMFIAASHNGISRLYETFGNGGADTLERALDEDDTARSWYKQNPPLPKALWSQRNNNNYQQTGILISLSHVADNSKSMLRSFYLKSKRSIQKPAIEGPAAYVFPADDPRPAGQAELLRLLQDQGCEVHRATAPFTVALKKGRVTEQKQFPAGSYLVRMDQPYSRIADMMLDYQYWSPQEKQVAYDDTAWTFGELGNVRVVRVADAKALDAAQEKIVGPVKAAGGARGNGGAFFVVNHNADNYLVSLRYKFPNATMLAAEEPFEAAGQKFNRGSFIIGGVSRNDLDKAAQELGLTAYALNAAPNVPAHPVKAARVAIMHTWLDTEPEGWWRIAFDKYGVPFTYISTQDAAKDANLRDKYDVIVFTPLRRNPQSVVNGLPLWGNALAWKKTPETPNLGGFTETDDMRPGLGLSGVAHLQEFVKRGGLFLTAQESSDFAVAYGFAAGVSAGRGQRLKAPGTALRVKMVDDASPIAYGYGEATTVFYSEGPLFSVSNTVGGRGGRRGGGERASGRGTTDDPDFVTGFPPAEPAPEPPDSEMWEAAPLTPEQKRNNYYIIPPQYRPRVVMRWADNRELFVSGLLEGGNEMAQRPAVIDIPMEQGHVVLFSNNPMWRGETQGSYFLVFNAILNFDSLNAGRKTQP
jgi:hypothetical protein